MSAIDDKYNALGGKSFLGTPVTDERVCPDGAGHYRHYQKGSIYWTQKTGAHVIYGFILVEWSRLGWEKSSHGYPTTDEANAVSGKGRFNNFQNGTIIWRTGAKQAFSVHGAIYDRWAPIGADAGPLGFPVTDETATPDKIGRFNHFEGGSVYWTPQTGAHVVKGGIRQAWAAQGWEVSKLQYPITDEVPKDGKIAQTFEGGEIVWSAAGGAAINYGPVKSRTVHCTTPPELTAGDVTASDIWVTFSSDGKWHFHAHLSDSGFWSGDYFGLAFVVAKDGHGAYTSGELGGQLSGPATEQDIDLGGTDPWIQNFWHKVVNSQIHFTLKKAPSYSIWEAIGADIKKYAPELIALIGSVL